MPRQEFRAPSGGLIDRSRILNFMFDGRPMTGHPGDTLASALLANGVRLVGRSFKYHRPRGIFGSGAEEPNALVTLENTREPNLKATQVELFDGLVARSQNCFPSRRFDIGSVANWLGFLLPAGFYYKTFMWPRRWWLFYERLIRQAAGFGKAATEPDQTRYAQRSAHCDLLIVGAGPAGIAAAAAAATKTDARIMLLDENPAIGGSMRGAGGTFGPPGPGDWVEQAVRTIRSSHVRILTRTTAFGYYDHNTIMAVEQAGPEQASSAGAPRQRLWTIFARQVIVATGAIERPLVFPGNDRPGVMLASAATRYARQFGVRPGRRAAIFTDNDGAYDCIDALKAAGTDVLAVLDTRTGGPGPLARRIAEAAGIEVISGGEVVSTHGFQSLTRIDYITARERNRRQSLKCDLLCVSGGWNPTVHLFAQTPGTLRFDESRSAFVPNGTWQQAKPVGGANGTSAIGQAIAEGIRAAAEALSLDEAALGSLPPPPASDADTPVGCEPIRTDYSPFFESHQKAFVDLQNDVTLQDIRLAHQEGYLSVEHLKRYTTLGMGTDQGKTSNVNGLSVMAGLRGVPIPSVGTTTFRPPYNPVTIGALAGWDFGRHLLPVRRTSLHECHRAQGAIFADVPPWKRPKCYPRAGETMEEAIDREALTVRRSVGIVDVSTLGKFDIQGPDAAAFLDRIYANPIASMKVGACRYGLMLREDGFLLDDGTVSRLSDANWYITSSTGRASAVHAHLEYYAQTVWNDLEVYITDLTDQFAAIAIAGPNSRDVLGKLFGPDKVSNEALPHMSVGQLDFDGTPVRILRMSFSGERAYELHVPARHAERLWRELAASGAAYGLAPYGTEAMNVLRIEKGHIAGNEIDGRTLVSDFDLERMMKKKGYFVGKRLLERPGLDGTIARRKIVGLMSRDGQPIPRGAQLIESPTRDRPARAIGHVSSTCHSPHLNASIALALILDRDQWLGKTVRAVCDLTSASVPVEVVGSVFIDPEGAKCRD